MKQKIVVSLLVTTAVALSPMAAHADAVTDWNAIALETIMGAPPGTRPGPVGFLDIAVVQAAVYDAVQAIGGTYKPYKVEIQGASGSPEAATAKAARDVLVSIFPDKAESLDTTYRGYLTQKGLKETDYGVAVGEKAAAGMIAAHPNNGRVPNPLPEPFRGDTKPGSWRPTKSYIAGPPPSDSPMASPWLGTVKSFTLKSGDQFRAKPPPALTSAEYTKDYNEVKELGGFAESKRTKEQTVLAQFYPGSSYKVVQTTLRESAEKHVDKIEDSARLMALGTIAMADTSITCWDSKKHFLVWRPITAVQEGEKDGNPETTGDPSWQPLTNTPPYPDYTSGANNVTAALTRTLSLFFGKDEMAFTVTSSNPKSEQKTRNYSRFSDMSADMVEARILQGIHFRFADVAGREQGRQVAEWVFAHVGEKKK